MLLLSLPPKSGVLNHVFLVGHKGSKTVKRCDVKGQMNMLPYVFLCTMKLIRGQTRMVGRPDLATGHYLRTPVLNSWQLYVDCTSFWLITLIHQEYGMNELVKEFSTSVLYANTGSCVIVYSLILMYQSVWPSFFPIVLKILQVVLSLSNCSGDFCKIPTTMK